MTETPEAMRAEQPAQRIKVLYIMGSGRSGSTVLDMALGSVPGIVSTGELANVFYKTDLTREYCSCGRLLAFCPFWSRVVAEMENHPGFSFQDYGSLQRRYERLRSFSRLYIASRSRHADFHRYLDCSVAIYRAVASAAGARVVVDSSKSPARALALLQSPAIELVPVHLVADPRSVAWSLQRAWKPDPEAGIQYALQPVSTVRAAIGWMATNWAAEHVKRHFPGTVFLRYEDFASDPHAALSRILKAIDADSAEDGFPAEILPGKLHVMAGNRVRRQKRVVIRMSDAWKHQMPVRKQRLVRSLTFPLMTKYGYPCASRSDMRRIILVIHSLGRGGAERILTELANYWAERPDYEILLITFAADPPDTYALNSKVHRWCLRYDQINRGRWHSIFRNVRAIMRLRHLLRRQRPDVILSFLTRVNVLTLLAGWGLNSRKIIAERIDPRFDRVSPVWRILRHVSYRLADRIVVQTESARSWFAGASPARRYAVIPNPLSQSFETEPSSTEDVRGQLRLPAEARILLGIGRLMPQKGFDRLIRAFAACQARQPLWHLVILGDGKERGRLAALAADCGVAAQVHFCGAVRSPRRWLQQADMFVLASRYEGFPNVLLEAMACGLAVVSFACPSGPEEIIRNGEDGILIEDGDVGGLTQALDALMNDEARRTALGKNARHNVRRYSAERVLPLWDNLLGIGAEAQAAEGRAASCGNGA